MPSPGPISSGAILCGRPRERKENDACPQSSSSSVRPTAGADFTGGVPRGRGTRGLSLRACRGSPRGDRCCGSRASSRCGESVPCDCPLRSRPPRSHRDLRWRRRVPPLDSRHDLRRNPDLGVVLEGSLPDAQGRTQPALVAEVVTRSSAVRDYQTKRREYLLFGIREYWIVDPLMRQVTVLSRTGERWAEQVARDEEPIPSQVLPGLECPTSTLWAGVVADDPGE